MSPTVKREKNCRCLMSPVKVSGPFHAMPEEFEKKKFHSENTLNVFHLGYEGGI